MLESVLKVAGLREELAQVDKYIDVFLETELETGVTADLFDLVRGTRGKMVRPILLLLAGRFGPDYCAARDRLCKLAAVVEVIHMASLIHDDIIDDSPLRRGRHTVQARFGKDMAVYAGDFMLSRVMYTLAKENLPRAGVTMGRAIEEMCRGELGQMACRWDAETTIETYLKNIYGKTAALFVAAAQLGAAESGCTERDIGYLGGMGENFGYIFQMRDDILDFTSEAGREGKPVHQDFADGIYTLPVLYALSHPATGARLREVTARGAAGAPGLTDEMCALVRAGGGIDLTWAQIENHAVQARRNLSALPRCAATVALEALVALITSGVSAEAKVK